jgi:hypothetical protein
VTRDGITVLSHLEIGKRKSGKVMVRYGRAKTSEKREARRKTKDGQDRDSKRKSRNEVTLTPGALLAPPVGPKTSS